MGRGTDQLYTSWIPLGDVPRAEGPLAILAGSNDFNDLIQTYGQLDVDRDKAKLDPALHGWLTLNPNAPQRQYGGRWLTSDFHLGDVLIFTMYTLHCSLDNRSPENRVRLSMDIRKQLASEPADSRWVGENAVGHDGRLYCAWIKFVVSGDPCRGVSDPHPQGGKSIVHRRRPCPTFGAPP